MRHPDCPLCQSPSATVERLQPGAFFCSVCGHVFILDDAGQLVRRHPTNHSDARLLALARTRKTDVSGQTITDGD